MSCVREREREREREGHSTAVVSCVCVCVCVFACEKRRLGHTTVACLQTHTSFITVSVT